LTRLTLLLPVVLFLTFQPHYARRVGGSWFNWETTAFVSALLLLVLLGRILASRIARHSGTLSLESLSLSLHRQLNLLRLLAMLATALGLYLLGWGELAWTTLSRLNAQHSELLLALFTALPAYLAWVGLYWSQYPAERALRERALLIHIEANLPVRSPPSLRGYLAHHIRTGPALMLLPVLGVLLVRDGITLALHLSGFHPNEWATLGVYLAAGATVFVLSPLLLVHILPTRPLPPGPLRDSLELLARRAGTRFSNILIWDTQSAAANALVTGVLPRFRYILLSDFLLETMPDRQIQSVFAHELGHLVHRHILWYALFLISISLALSAATIPLQMLEQQLKVSLAADLTSSVASLAIMLLLFGVISRRFERQADLFSARALPADTDPIPAPPSSTGAALFADALTRVAYLNNIPLHARNWTHGSIAHRIHALFDLAQYPHRLLAFNRLMLAIRALILTLGAASVATLLLT
jgi:STE24 endopeptidase